MPADPSKPEGFGIDKNHLHIWPRHNFMLIGLPNKVRFVSAHRPHADYQDGSFTLTLFAPFESLATIETRQEAAKFFHDNFPSAVAIAGEKQLLNDFENNPRGNLVTINVGHPSFS